MVGFSFKPVYNYLLISKKHYYDRKNLTFNVFKIKSRNFREESIQECFLSASMILQLPEIPDRNKFII